MSDHNCEKELTLCPECVQYIRYCTTNSTAQCPFCDASFSPDELKGTRPSAAAATSRWKSGVMTASFVGATVLGGVACTAQDQPVYGEPIAENEYPGERDAGSDADDADVDDADVDDADVDDADVDDADVEEGADSGEDTGHDEEGGANGED